MERNKEIYKVTLVGGAANVFLLLIKFLAGVLGHSAAMIADAVHSLSDFVTDIIVLVFIRISGKPQDKDHDYGHGKYETLADAFADASEGDTVLLLTDVTEALAYGEDISVTLNLNGNTISVSSGYAISVTAGELTVTSVVDDDGYATGGVAGAIAVSEGADTLFINVTGTVTSSQPTPPEPPTPPAEGEYARISDLSQLTEGCLVVFAARFDENATDVYRDGTHVMHATGTLAGSYADCAAAGGYILVGADDSGDDDLFYLSDFRIYEGTVAVPEILAGTTSAYDDWAAANGAMGACVFRYLFDKPSGSFENPPLLSISFDASGRAVIHTPPLNPSATGFDISILATDDLAGAGGTTYPLDPSGETTIPASDKPARFFRLRVIER